MHNLFPTDCLSIAQRLYHFVKTAPECPVCSTQSQLGVLTMIILDIYLLVEMCRFVCNLRLAFQNSVTCDPLGLDRFLMSPQNSAEWRGPGARIMTISTTSRVVAMCVFSASP